MRCPPRSLSKHKEPSTWHGVKNKTRPILPTRKAASHRAKTNLLGWAAAAVAAKRNLFSLAARRRAPGRALWAAAAAAAAAQPRRRPPRFQHAPLARFGQSLLGQLSDGGRARELVIAKKTLLKKTLLGYVFVTAVGAWSAATGASPDAGPCARPIRFGGHRAATPAAQPAKGTRATEPVRDRAGRVGRRPTVGLGTMPVYLFW